MCAQKAQTSNRARQCIGSQFSQPFPALPVSTKAEESCGASFYNFHFWCQRIFDSGHKGQKVNYCKLLMDFCSLKCFVLFSGWGVGGGQAICLPPLQSPKSSLWAAPATPLTSLAVERGPCAFKKKKGKKLNEMSNIETIKKTKTGQKCLVFFEMWN